VNTDEDAGSDCKIPELEMGKPEISMAPLVDIVFLLLIFFMVTTVFPEKNALLIEKPQSDNSTFIREEQIIIKLDRLGDAFYKDQKITVADIARILKNQLQLNPALAVIVHADKRASTESLINIIDAAKAGGAQKLGIATDEKRKS